MTSAAEAAALTFDRAYRNAGGRGDARSFLRTGAPVLPATRPRVVGTFTQVATHRRLHPDEGRGEFELCSGSMRMHHGRWLQARTETMLTAIAASSLARAERRRAAILASGEEGDPEWSMTAHPLVSAAMRLYGIAARPLRIGDEAAFGGEVRVDEIGGHEHDGARANLRTLAGHVWAPFLRETRTGLGIDETRGRTMARLTIPDMTVPDTVATGMKGSPLSHLLDHELVDLVPDLRISRIRNDAGSPTKGRAPSTIVEIRARAVPLATAPAGIDVDWRRLPVLHYADVG